MRLLGEPGLVGQGRGLRRGSVRGDGLPCGRLCRRRRLRRILPGQRPGLRFPGGTRRRLCPGPAGQRWIFGVVEGQRLFHRLVHRVHHLAGRVGGQFALVQPFQLGLGLPLQSLFPAAAQHIGQQDAAARSLAVLLRFGGRIARVGRQGLGRPSACGRHGSRPGGQSQRLGRHALALSARCGGLCPAPFFQTDLQLVEHLLLFLQFPLFDSDFLQDAGLQRGLPDAGLLLRLLAGRGCFGRIHVDVHREFHLHRGRGVRFLILLPQGQGQRRISPCLQPDTLLQLLLEQTGQHPKGGQPQLFGLDHRHILSADFDLRSIHCKSAPHG